MGLALTSLGLRFPIWSRGIITALSSVILKLLRIKWVSTCKMLRSLRIFFFECLALKKIIAVIIITYDV